MEQQSRRGLLKNAAKAAAVATGGIVLGKLQRRRHRASLKKSRTQPAQIRHSPAEAPLFSSAVSYGNLLFLAGVGAHFKGTIEEHTKHVLDELEKNLIGAGSSMEKVLKVNGLPERHQRLGEDEHRVRGPLGQHPSRSHHHRACRRYPGNSLVEIDLIAYI